MEDDQVYLYIKGNIKQMPGMQQNQLKSYLIFKLIKYPTISNNQNYQQAVAPLEKQLSN